MSYEIRDKRTAKVSGGEVRLTHNSIFLVLKKYIGLTKPERTLANVFTGLAGFLFASKWHINSQLLLSFIGGLTLIIASACVLNNLIDRDLDRNMARTKKRALVTGEIATRNAIIFAVVIGVLGFWLLAQTNWITFWISALAGYVGYVALYDFAKRKSVWGTLAGTICGGASIVAGYTAASGRLDTAAFLLFIIMAVWQMAHFYSIAIFRLPDYKKAGVPVWPAKYGVANTKAQIFIFIAAFLAANALLAIFGYVKYSYLIVVSGAGGYWYWRAVAGITKQVDDTKWARRMFGVSLKVLFVFAVALTVGPVVR